MSMMKLRLASTLALGLLASAASAQTPAKPSSGEPAFRALFKELVETDTSAPGGDCTKAVTQVAERMKAAGFPAANLQIIIPDGKPKDGNLVAIYPGKDPKAKAVLMLGHIDVVVAKREDWTRDPYVMVEEGGYFYARGVADMKAQSAIWADNMIRYNAEGYKPLRTIKMALTCGEDGPSTNGARWLVDHNRELIDAGIALNEGGGGDFDAAGKPLAHTVAVAEKTSATFTLEVTNPGGHSSRPRPDNAIYSLARGLDRMSQHDFPVQFNDANRGYFTAMSKLVGGEQGAAMAALIANPKDEKANAVVSASPLWHTMLRTTCVATMMDAGHAGNALPQRARATVNCRMFPGDTAEATRASLVSWIADPEVKVSIPPARTAGGRAAAPAASEKVMGPVQRTSAKIWPGVPVVAILMPAATDGTALNAAGIPTYGITGLFRDADGGGIHGLNERIRVSSVMNGRDFLYGVIKAYADQKD
jgi:acetylornithine deacetylase/succinyl-diaminopimelate desuccinylase-like protein